MAVLLNNVPCLCPATLAWECRDLAIRADWFGGPNSYRCPDGHAPGEAQVLLSRSALQRLDPAGTLPGPFDLEFQVADQSGYTTRAKILNLTPTACQCVTPGARGDEAAYLLTLADRRLLDGRVIADVGFDVRHRFAGHDLTAAVTWQGAVTYLWTLMDLPGDDTLPVVPPYQPEDLEYWQTPALEALDDVANRCGCRLCYNPLSGNYRIVEAGADDAAFAGALNVNNPRRVWDDYSRPPARGKVPAAVRVLFAKLPHVRGLNGSPWYAVELPDPEPGERPWAADVPVGVQTLQDDHAAEYDAAGDLMNEGELQARAAARVRQFYRELDALLDDQGLFFAGALPDPGFLPGPLVSAVAWSDAGSGALPGRGVITEVVRRGSPLAPAFGPRTIDPLTEIVRIAGAKRPDGLMDAWYQRWDPVTKKWIDRYRVWAIDASDGLTA